MRASFKTVLSVIFLFSSLLSFGQSNFFSRANEGNVKLGSARRLFTPDRYNLVSADLTQLRAFLWALPSEASLADRSAAPVIQLPMPDGSTAKFRVWESSIQEKGLEAKFPEIKTFNGQGVDDPYATIRMDFNPYFGFHAQVLSIHGRIYIDPFARGNTQYYMSYYHSDNHRPAPFNCGIPAEADAQLEQQTGAKLLAGPCRGTQLYTYRLAVACTGEYAVAVGGSTAASLHAAIVTSVNRVVGVYEKEAAVRMVLVANNNLVEFLNASTDPFNGNNNANTLINESQTVIGNTIGSANYDIGHTFSTGGGGLAQLGAVCGASKARGITGSPQPFGDGYDIDYVAHEMGHQFGGSHTFNSVTSSCNGNRTASAAYEVGSGTTIQAYAGICGTDNIQPNSDPYFHAFSFDQISTFLEAGGLPCRVATATGNTLPVINSMDNNNISIPIGTPFTLTASASDADGDAITYNWEEWDLGAAGAWNSGANSTSAPLFKSRIPKTNGSRTFPDMAVILANYPANPATTMNGLKGETLAQVARPIKFKLTVRDNRAAGGGVVSGGDGCQANMTGIFQINTTGTTPFAVTVPNGGESYPGGSLQTITWNVAGSNLAPVSTTDVKISLSTDGGLTYPTVLVASTPNDGSELLALPSVVSSTARVKVEAVNNIFFDISNANFNITAALNGFDFDNPAAATVTCSGPATASVTLNTTVTGTFSTPINLSASGNPAGTTVTFGTNPVNPGSSTVVTLNGINTLAAGTYSITVTGTAGSVVKTRIVQFTVQAGSAPTVTLQPTPQSVCVGTTATFTAAGSGTSYQWQSSNDGVNFTDIAGATSASYTTPATTAAMNNVRYRVLVLTQCGSTPSSSALLTVNASPSITSQPQSTTLCAGSSASFNVTASGGGLSYQWQVNTSATGGTFNNIAGATNSTYTAAGITSAMNNYRYRVIVTGTCAPAITSGEALLTVVDAAVITTQPVSVANCETGTVSFSVAGTSSPNFPIIYQWQVSTDNGQNWTNVANSLPYSGANTATLTITGVMSTMNNYRYRVVLSNAICTGGTISNTTTPAVLTVNARPTVTLTASRTTLTPGQTAVLSANIQPSATGFVISWYRNNVLIPGATATTYTADVTQLGEYRVEIVNSTTGCNNVSNSVTIAAQPSQQFFIYPNPNNGRFTIAYYNSGAATTRTVNIYDAKGALVYQKTFTVSLPYQLLPVEMTKDAQGIYLVVLSDSGGRKVAVGKVMIGLH